jgi:hypothetical protein
LTRAAFDAVKKGKFVAGTKDGQPRSWIVVSVKFAKSEWGQSLLSPPRGANDLARPDP